MGLIGRLAQMLRVVIGAPSWHAGGPRYESLCKAPLYRVGSGSFRCLFLHSCPPHSALVASPTIAEVSTWFYTATTPRLHDMELSHLSIRTLLPYPSS
jgi:hypothetical protein